MYYSVDNDTNLFIVCGLARHGKDTVCTTLKNYYGLQFQSSSIAALDIFLFARLKELGFMYKSKLEAFEDRINNRVLWHEEIKAFNTPDKAKLARYIFANNNIYCGLRCNLELQAIKNWAGLAGKRLHVIWVDASFRMGNDTESVDSITISQSDCDAVIYNNESISQLISNTISVMDKLVYREIVDKIISRGLDCLSDAEYAIYNEHIKDKIYGSINT